MSANRIDKGGRGRDDTHEQEADDAVDRGRTGAGDRGAGRVWIESCLDFFAFSKQDCPGLGQAVDADLG